MVSTDKVKVAVRVRPLNRREIELGAKYVVDMDSSQTFLYNPNFGIKDGNDGGHVNPKNIPKTFAFDHCFWSVSENNSKYASQAQVFDCLGKDILKRAFEGYNACIFAYGQTGSGKSYSMMGTSDQKGIIPRLCDALFDEIVQSTDSETNFKVEVSYLEIYNEKVRDLLDPKGRVNLKVREHNILGSYVDGLSTLAVSSFQDIDTLMCEGNKSRTVAATNMNSESSRSHAVFNIILTQTLINLQADVSGEKVSKISLVDLAGSERAQKTGAMGERLKEGSNINKSLTTLGLVISALADQASGKSKNKFVPYRDSVLTWLLKDNLGGNSKTVMIATLSPSADNYEETLSTLRYADRAKRIVNHAVVNEDPNARIIRELREEVDMLRKMLTEAKQSVKPVELQERLEESEKLMKEIGKTWEEKLNETERIHLERHAALEKMGISVETSGIKVEQGKHYLVNLNADPCLNELLVYYLKEHTLIGRPDADYTQDIQLYGLGIMPQHCIMTIEGLDVYIQPIKGARTCVNGRTITDRMRVKHGDRIVWGSYHFFRLNCPKTSPSAETPENIDYDFAQQELMLQQMVGDPIQEAINSIEKQHEEDKQVALEKQRLMYERQMQKLRNQLMSPGAPSMPYTFDSFSKLTPTAGTPSAYSSSTYATIPSKYQFWAKDREKIFRQSLCKLKEEVVKANTLVSEANFLAQELSKDVEYSVTLQIPATNLSPNRKKGAFVSEPAILVKYKNSNRASQVWSMEKFENRVIDMRDCYEDYKEIGCLNSLGEDEFVLEHQVPAGRDDPFFDTNENRHLIGVANVFLEVLFYDAKLDYHVPIINQQGEVSGRLHVEISRLNGRFIEDTSSLTTSYLSGDGVDPMNESHVGSFIECNEGDDGTGFSIGNYAMCRVVVKEARGLPPAVSNLVFCRYNFWGCPEPVKIKPILDQNYAAHCCPHSNFGNFNCGCHPKQPVKITFENMTVKFNHTKEFLFQVTEEFLEHCADGALSIEVWGHRGTELRGLPGWGIEQVHAKSRSMLDRWNELTRKIELWVEIHELNDQGDYVPVEVVQQGRMEIPTGGAYQLRQGYSRRILVSMRPVQNSGTLPIICESIEQISIGCVCARSKLQKGLDSYQEEDLNLLRQKWSEALEKRREYLDEQLQKIMNKKAEDKTEADAERECSLIDQWVCLAEERNAVLVPAVGSCIPGAPADWDHAPTMEQHIPVVFLDLNAEDMSTPSAKEGLQAVGCNSILPKEQGTKFFPLSFVKTFDKEVSVLASWDSSVHDSIHLNRITPSNERVYLILKVVVRLSHPARMEVVLRKRICINVYKKQSFTDKLKKKIGKADFMSATGVTYEFVSNIPKSSEELEDRESLAQIAASQNNQDTSDGETYIEKYIKGVSAVESILMLDRLRQDVAVKEILSVKGRPLRKATSVPNIYNILTSPCALQEPIRSDSNHDVSQTSTATCRPDGDYFYHTTHQDVVQFKKDCGIGSSYSVSPAQNKHKPLSTLVEEKPCKKASDVTSDGYVIEECYEEEEENEEDENDDYPLSINDSKIVGDINNSHDDMIASTDNTLKYNNNNHNSNNNDLTSSTTLPATTTSSLTASSMKASSLASSGYGGSNQAISTVTLSSEDSLSMQSVEDVTANSTEHADHSSNNSFCANNLFINDNKNMNHSNSDTNQAIAATNVTHNSKPNNNDDDEVLNINDDVKSSNYNADDLIVNGGVDNVTGLQVAGISNVVLCSAEVLVDNSHPDVAATGDNADIKNNHNSCHSHSYQSEIIKDADSNNGNIAGHTLAQSQAYSQEVTDDSVSVCSFGSRADLHRLNEVPPPSWIQYDEPVFVSVSGGQLKPGLVKYIGRTEFAPGMWVGVELDTADGKNDGYVKGVRYFRCKNHHGVFVRHEKLSHDKKRAHNRSAGKNANASAATATPYNGGKVAATLRRSMNNLTSPLVSHSRDGRGSPNINNNNNNNKSHNNSLNGSAVILNTSTTTSSSSTSSSFMKATVSSSGRRKQ